MKRKRTRSSERGAVLIHAGIAIIALMSFSALSVDYGVMWVARRQAQNAADAAALAGAYSLAFKDPTPDTGYALARTRAVLVAQQNAVWGEAPAIDAGDDVEIGPCSTLAPGSTPAGATCLQANVFRDAANGNALPTFFARLVGVTSQDVTATATAQIVPGNAVKCIKPWALPNKWIDNLDDDVSGADDGPPQWTWNDTYDKYDNHGQILPGTVDNYTGPEGSGFKSPEDVGMQVRIKPQQPQESIVASWFFPVRLPGNTGADDYREAIAGCWSGTVEDGQLLDTENGNMVGPTKQGVDDLIAEDPGAVWDEGSKSIQGSCAQFTPPCAAESPRIVPIPVFDPDEYLATAYGSGKHEVRVERILGFFVEEFDGKDLIGRFMGLPGELAAGQPIPDDTSAFLMVIRLVR
jgi:hypothetical protein